jgi:hypothetical protein
VRGLPTGGPLIDHNPRPAKSRGVKGSIPQCGGRQPRDCPGGCRRSRHQRDNRLQSSGDYSPLAIPFLGPKPVFEIKPQGLGLRASPCRRVDSGQARTHPVMLASLWICGVLSRGGWSPASQQEPKQMSRKDAHAFASTTCVNPSPPPSWSRPSSSRQGIEPLALSPPMKSMATRSLSWPSMTPSRLWPAKGPRLGKRLRCRAFRSAPRPWQCA